MQRIALSVSFAFALFFVSPAHSQLGPTDGAELLGTDLDRIKIGDTAPDFTLGNADGKRITLSSFRGKKTVVLVFYRGYW